MAKKKTTDPVVYTPISDNVPLLADNIQDVPQYDDRGISYKKYSKILTGNKQYKLKIQDTRFYFIGIVAGQKDNYTPRTDYSRVNFYARTFIITYRVAADCFFTVYDNNSANPKFRIPLLIGSGQIVINFHDSPRSFEQQNFLITSTTLAGADYFLAGTEIIAINAFGWDEEK